MGVPNFEKHPCKEKQPICMTQWHPCPSKASKTRHLDHLGECKNSTSNDRQGTEQNGGQIQDNVAYTITNHYHYHDLAALALKSVSFKTNGIATDGIDLVMILFIATNDKHYWDNNN